VNSGWGWQQIILSFKMEKLLDLKILDNRTMKETGIITKISAQSFSDTYEKLKNIIANNPNLKILLELDHQSNAASAGLTLSPTRIILFGNPKLGTPLMQSGEYTGLDLPQKILVSEREGVVSISYNDPLYLKNRHQIKGQEEILEKVAGALNKITTAASSL